MWMEMALRVGLRRASRLLTRDSFLRVTSTTENFAGSFSEVAVRRVCFEASRSRLAKSTNTISSASQSRPFCSGKDIDSGEHLHHCTRNGCCASRRGSGKFPPSKRHDLAMLFTCKVCETRSAKTMSRHTYETGIVIVRCPNCRNLHLIADRLGWFGEKGSVEDFLEQQGVSVRKGLEGSYEFAVDDLTGWTPPRRESNS